MSNSAKEVAFRKRRRDYVLNHPKNEIRANTKIIKVKQDKFIPPEVVLTRARQTRNDKKRYEINCKRRESPNFPQPSQDIHVAIIIRLAKRKDNLCAETRKIMTEFHLNEQFDGSFVYLNDENRQKLKSISHLITWGAPSKELIRQLIHTKGHTVIDGKETPITSNKMVSEALKQFNIICLDDMVDSLSRGTENSEAVCRFLAPFHFTQTDLDLPKRPIHAGGSAGWRGEGITQFVESII